MLSLLLLKSYPNVLSLLRLRRPPQPKRLPNFLRINFLSTWCVCRDCFRQRSQIYFTLLGLPHTTYQGPAQYGHQGHPQTDAQSKTLIRTFLSMPRAYIQKVPRQLYKPLSEFVFQYNASKNASTGLSPFEVDIGRILHTTFSRSLAQCSTRCQEAFDDTERRSWRWITWLKPVLVRNITPINTGNRWNFMSETWWCWVESHWTLLSEQIYPENVVKNSYTLCPLRKRRGLSLTVLNFSRQWRNCTMSFMCQN